MDAAIRNQGASIKALEIQIGEMSKVLQERGSGSLPGLTKTNPRDHVKSISIILNRSLDPVYGDYIKLNDLNEPLKLRRNQVEDLGLTIEEGEVIDEPMEDIVKTRNDDNEISNGIDEYPSFCDFDRKIHIDCAYNLQFSCMIGISDVIVGKVFCREIYVKARRFDGMITIYNGHDNVSARDKLNGIPHPYQKLKSFYKGVLNLGPEYIRDAKTVEWLTHGYVSMHEME
ncbi:hypothetical protein Tco_0099035 [Tanacetum coccineum]